MQCLPSGPCRQSPCLSLMAKKGRTTLFLVRVSFANGSNQTIFPSAFFSSHHPSSWQIRGARQCICGLEQSFVFFNLSQQRLVGIGRQKEEGEKELLLSFSLYLSFCRLRRKFTFSFCEQPVSFSSSPFVSGEFSMQQVD
jgi:hypothetical protein